MKKIIIFILILCFGLNINIAKAQTQLDSNGIRKQFCRWNKVNGKVSSGLSKLRATEADLFEGNASNRQVPPEETQLGMNEQAYQVYKKTDKELNRVYNQILNKYKKDKIFISKLQKAELAWMKFRDAEIEAIYPEEDKLYNYGSVYPMCHSDTATIMTQERIDQLKLWINGGSCEGNVCAGSIPFKPEKNCK